MLILFIFLWKEKNLEINHFYNNVNVLYHTSNCLVNPESVNRNREISIDQFKKIFLKNSYFLKIGLFVSDSSRMNTHPLTTAELEQAISVSKANFGKPVDGYNVVVATVDLKEPNKQAVLADDNNVRSAVVLLYENFTNVTTQIVVLLNQGPNKDQGALQSKEVLPDVIPPMNDRNSGNTIMSGPNGDFDTLIDNVVKMIEFDSPEAQKYRDGLNKRGITLNQIGSRFYPCLECTFEMLRKIPDGNKETCECPEKLGPNEQGRFFLLTLIDENADWIDGYLDGLNAVVNVTINQDGVTGRIVRTIDEYQVPELTPGIDGSNPTITHPKFNPVKLIQPGGANYTYDHSTGRLTWDNWSFNIGFSSRTGIQFYNIKYADSVAGENRQILYKASVSDAIVVYNTNKPQPLRNFVSSDTLSYPMGYRLTNLRKGIDVPDLATLYDIPTFDIAGNTKDGNGKPLVLKEALGIFEEWGDTIWRANDGADLPPGAPAIGVAGNNLVIRSLFSGFFYLWQFSWTFRADGIIDMDIKIGGRTINQSISWESDSDKLNELGYLGQFVTKYKFGLNHTHIHNLRFDFAIDGVNNTAVEERWEKVSDKQRDKGCGHSYNVREVVLETEKGAVRDLDPSNGVTWKVENKNAHVKGIDFDAHPGYELVPGRNGYQTQNFASCSSSKTQFEFTQHNTFVTRYHENEQYASGAYPVQGSEDTGLGKYIADDENIVNKDIVLWHTMLVSHQPHLEDGPYIPLVGQSVRLQPHNFFAANPAIQLTPNGPVPQMNETQAMNSRRNMRHYQTSGAVAKPAAAKTAADAAKPTTAKPATANPTNSKPTTTKTSQPAIRNLAYYMQNRK